MRRYLWLLYAFYLYLAVVAETRDPCNPSPCGPNSQCVNRENQAVCSCLPNYVGSPPGCRPECVVSSECVLNKACMNKKCVDPCPGSCGLNARCEVINHSPICSCRSEFTGDPFLRCSAMQSRFNCFRSISLKVIAIFSFLFFLGPVVLHETSNPCVPSPCGANAICQVFGLSHTCSCLPSYVGSPPNCRPECTINSECQSNLACLREKCRDPCQGSCGLSAICTVINHTPMCTCPSGLTGDPFSNCHPQTPERKAFINLLRLC